MAPSHHWMWYEINVCEDVCVCVCDPILSLRWCILTVHLVVHPSMISLREGSNTCGTQGTNLNDVCSSNRCNLVTYLSEARLPTRVCSSIRQSIRLVARSSGSSNVLGVMSTLTNAVSTAHRPKEYTASVMRCQAAAESTAVGKMSSGHSLYVLRSRCSATWWSEVSTTQLGPYLVWDYKRLEGEIDS